MTCFLDMIGLPEILAPTVRNWMIELPEDETQDTVIHSIRLTKSLTPDQVAVLLAAAKQLQDSEDDM